MGDQSWFLLELGGGGEDDTCMGDPNCNWLFTVEGVEAVGASAAG
jgi:hypothetical protein